MQIKTDFFLIFYLMLLITSTSPERSVLDRLRVSALALGAVIGGIGAALSGDEQDVFGL
ncbi:hypothetical protein SC206_07680 [Rouxiella sp. T17]|uniref:hypothetical protein n=1 Tax=Rouxiella sp. T17 TaxID=3085684 RepID=UPI002FC7FF27